MDTGRQEGEVFVTNGSHPFEGIGSDCNGTHTIATLNTHSLAIEDPISDRPRDDRKHADPKEYVEEEKSRAGTATKGRGLHVEHYPT